jgi:molecular chaperone DnaJ
MASKRDYYDILGLQKNATPEQVKQAYKELAKKYHPDLNKEAGAEEKFKEVLEAYTILSDSQKRQAYDNYGFESPEFSNFDFNEFARQGGGRFDFSDLFGDLGFDPFEQFFGTQKKQTAQRGFDLRVDLEIELEEAVAGTEKTIEVSRIEKCDECNGTGSKDKESSKCPACNGKGVVERTQRTPFGIFSTRTTCPKCRGSGTVIKNPCRKCNGTGQVRGKKKITVKIPAGIDNGNHLRLKGEGNSGSKGGVHGDLYIIMFVKPHKIFKRDRTDLFVEVPISFTEAALGEEIEVPLLLAGKAKLKIPEGTQTGTLFKLKGLGVKAEGRTGDLYVKAIVKTPESLNSKQKALFEDLAKLDGFKERQDFFGSLKKKFGK